jgi:hypothetical protein
MPVILFKAIEGFGDRLQVLCHCLRYCEKYDTKLCVDWTDPVWGYYGFDFIFQIIGIRTIPKGDVVSFALSGAEIRPPAWTVADIEAPTSKKVLGNTYIGEFMNLKENKCPGDILATNGRGKRIWDTGILAKYLRLRPNISKKIFEILPDLSQTTVFHLRGTDRRSEEFMKEAIKIAYETPRPIMVVTDSKALLDEFVSKIPGAKLVNPNAQLIELPDAANGTHQTARKTLKKLQLSKWEMTIDLLADFFAIALAKNSFGMKESTFYEMASMLGKIPRKDLLRLMNAPS